MYKLSAMIAEGTIATTENLTGGGIWGILLYMGAFLVIIYFLMIMPQKKRDKKMKQMLSELSVGDLVTSIGGITGTVVNIKDNEITVETSIEKTKIDFLKSAIRDVNTVKS